MALIALAGLAGVLYLDTQHLGDQAFGVALLASVFVVCTGLAE